MENINNSFLSKHKKFRTDSKKLATLFLVSAFIIAIIVFWCLKLIGITATSEAFCGLDEHMHNEECYASEIICQSDNTTSIPDQTDETESKADANETTDESVYEEESHTNEQETTDSTEKETESTETQLTQETEATSTHTHSEECYEKTLICDKTEHTHTADCFPDKTADVETVSDWLDTIDDVTITNNIPENLVAIALSQIEYAESEKNFEFDSEGNKNGYTRYGEWYGNAYGKWNAIFVSFCLHYSNVNNVSELKSAGAEAMKLAWENKGVYTQEKDYVPSYGDIIFMDNDGDGKEDSVGIVSSVNKTDLEVIMGDSNDRVEKVNIVLSDKIIGYGLTSELYFAKDMQYTSPDEMTTTEAIEEATTKHTEETSSYENDISHTAEETSVAENNKQTTEPTVVTDETDASEPESTTKKSDTAQTEQTNKDESSTQHSDEIEITGESVNIDAPPLKLFNSTRANITYINDLTSVVKAVTFKTTEGEVIDNNSTVYVGQTYVISMEFSEDNTGDEWVQFQHDDDHHLHYQIPENIHCEPFTEWHPITAKTENGTIENVGEYFINEDGFLIVVFKDDPVTGECFGAKYSNVDFVIDFNATVGSTQSGTSTEVVFNDEIRVNLNIDTKAEMNVTKTHGTYNGKDNTLDYQIKIEATKAVIKNLVVPDDIWENHHVLRDTIVVTDLEGNVLDPQPTIGDGTPGATGGFTLTGFPDFAAGEGYIINYKSAINDNLLSQDEVGLWNGVYPYGESALGEPVKGSADDWVKVELNKIEKGGKQSVITDENENHIPVIEWEIEIKKSDTNLQGTVVVDTLGHGLEYYTGKDIKIKRYDQWGSKLGETDLSWSDVDIDGNSMSFPLPDGHRFVIVYYTTYEELQAGEQKQYTNTAKVTINQKEEIAGGEADVVGFIPYISKSASGDDGEYVYFTIEADVPGVIKDWGGFFLTDLAAFWGYNENEEGYLYAENIPEGLVITAVTESGRTINFTAYKKGGPIENTYILVAPVEGNKHHSFNVYFNTSSADSTSSKWILSEDSRLTISYKIPFDAKTGTQWTGELQGDKTIEDLLLQNYKLANEAYLNYTDIIQVTGTSIYDYSPMLTKKSSVNDDGTVDYTVTFYNTVPGSGGNQGYLTSGYSINFNDTFDERLEYVEGSLMVTCYDPWNNSVWYNKYAYDGEISGNTISVQANQLKLSQSNPDLPSGTISWISHFTDYQKYCNQIGAGGKHIFTYKLKLKDEYLNSTEENKYILDNTAELKWSGDNSSGPATDTVEIKTGLLDKHVVQENNKLLFDIHINKNALDILKGSETIMIEDTMSHNLSVYWDSIKLLYQNKDGNWIDFDSENSKYKYTVTYDQTANKLTFVLPDSLHIRIDYTTLITESGQVSVNNSVKVDGKAQVSDIIDATFKVEQHSGGATGSIHSITLLKQDGETDVRLPDVTFHLYGPMGNPHATIPNGAEESVVTDKNKTLYYIGSYTTGSDGTVKIESQYLTFGGPYVLVEASPPEGYNALEKPVYFYFYEPDPNGIIQTVTTLIAVENYTYGFVLPETGGTGTLPLAIIGISLMAYPILYSIIRRKRERRLL